MIVANNEIDATKNAGKLTTISTTWMPPSGEYSHRIAAAAAMVDNFE